MYLVSSLYWTRMQVNILWEQSSRVQDGQERVIVYVNKAMNAHKRAYYYKKRTSSGGRGSEKLPYLPVWTECASTYR